MKYRSSTVLRAAAIGALGLGLSACANPQADQALYAQRAFIGMPKQTLLSCAGVPDRQAAVDNAEYYTYSSERITTQQVPGHFGFGGYYGWRRPWGWGPGFGGLGFDSVPDIETKSCEATFTLKNGVVQQVVYGGSTDSPSGRLGQCYTIVQNCLALIPSQTQPAGSVVPTAR